APIRSDRLPQNIKTPRSNAGAFLLPGPLQRVGRGLVEVERHQGIARLVIDAVIILPLQQGHRVGRVVMATIDIVETAIALAAEIGADLLPQMVEIPPEQRAAIIA